MQTKIKHLPKYLQIREDLMSQISNGKLKPGDRIPSENILPKIFNTSKATAVKAVSELVRDGYIEKINGKGSFVTNKAGIIVLNIGVFDCNPKLLELFENENPTIQIKITQYDHNNFHDVIMSEKIDVYQLSDYEFHYMAVNNLLIDLWEFFTPSSETQADFYTEVLRLFNFRGCQYAIPYLFSPIIMFHNKNIFEKANLSCPQATWKWADLIKIAEQLTIKDKKDNFYKIFGLVFAKYRNRWPFFILQNGGEVISQPDENCHVDSFEAIDAIRFIADLLFKHRVMPVYFQDTTKDIAQTFFKEQRAAMLLSSYYTLASLKDNNFNIAISSPPQGKKKINGLIADAFGISTETNHFKAAHKFISFILSHKAQSLIKKLGIAIPTIKTIAESKHNLPTWISPDEYFKFKSMLQNSRKIIDISDTRLLELFWVQLDKVWANLESPTIACKTASAEINKVLNF